MLGPAISIAILVLLALVIHGSIVKNRWGINLKPVACPSCGTMMPRTRMPSSSRQAIWGGFTCPKCGCEMDKWGRRLSAT
jgi:hypothetical protein